VQGPRQVSLHFYYVPDSRKKIRNWDSLAVYMPRVMAYYNKRIGPYPYRKYSFIQAGDGGMEYAMCTFIMGNRPLGSLVGTSMHELAHSWFQFVIATDESRYPWMDEGFTTFISSLAMNEIWYKPRGESKNYIYDFIKSVKKLKESGADEPVSMYSDFYDSHAAYWTNAYDKGALFLGGLMLIGGEKRFWSFLHRYYAKWKFKHPEPADMLRTAEKSLDMELDWYYNHWIEGLKYPDYAVDTVVPQGDTTLIRIVRRGNMQVPVTISIFTQNGIFLVRIPYVRTLHYLRENELDTTYLPTDFKIHTMIAKPWRDGVPVYDLRIPLPNDKIFLVLIDNFRWFYDDRPLNNIWKSKSIEH
jgi:aminopeptidase N